MMKNGKFTQRKPLRFLSETRQFDTKMYIYITVDLNVLKPTIQMYTTLLDIVQLIHFIVGPKIQECVSVNS
jgi:hypothetical protein